MSKMEKEFIPYEQALALKELGFDEPCLAYWDDDKSFELNSEFLKGSQMDDSWLNTPTFSQAFRWFREKYDLDNWVYKSRDCAYFYSILKDSRYLSPSIEFTSHKEAEIECLKKLIKIVKKK